NRQIGDTVGVQIDVFEAAVGSQRQICIGADDLKLRAIAIQTFVEQHGAQVLVKAGQVQSGVSAQEDIIIYCQCLDVGYATGEVQTAQGAGSIGFVNPQCVFAFAHVNSEVAVYSAVAYQYVVIANASLDAFEICATGHIKIEVTGVLCAVQGFE